MNPTRRPSGAIAPQARADVSTRQGAVFPEGARCASDVIVGRRRIVETDPRARPRQADPGSIDASSTP